MEKRPRLDMVPDRLAHRDEQQTLRILPRHEHLRFLKLPTVYVPCG
jgi:hypothetical protein